MVDVILNIVVVEEVAVPMVDEGRCPWWRKNKTVTDRGGGGHLSLPHVEEVNPCCR
uniref:Uncharacterized protein n=1 Tax=Salix viminalis TaxID=40686 RepID=A0A6N2KGC9_SALVM